MIFSCSLVGLTKNLKRSPGFAIQKAQLTMQIKRVEQQIADRQARQADVATLKARIAHEFDMFTSTLEDWARLKEEWCTEKKAELMQKWRDTMFRDRFR